MEKVRIPKFATDMRSYDFIAARAAITHDLLPFDFHFLRYAVLRHSTLLTIGRYKGRTFRQTLGLATLKDIFYSCDVFEGAEKHILLIQARIEPGESYFHLRLSARIFNFKILPEPGLQSRLFRSR